MGTIATHLTGLLEGLNELIHVQSLALHTWYHCEPYHCDCMLSADGQPVVAHYIRSTQLSAQDRGMVNTAMACGLARARPCSTSPLSAAQATPSMTL